MNRRQLAHVLRSASIIADDADVVVLGSQSILGTYDEDELPPEATASQEADVAFLDDLNRKKADSVDGAIGEMSAFHDLNGYYAEGIHVDTATLPNGWRDRTVEWPEDAPYAGEAAPARARFLEKHDLAIAKLAAYREKDLEFVGALVAHELLDLETLVERIWLLPDSVPQQKIDLIAGWVTGAMDHARTNRGP